MNKEPDKFCEPIAIVPIQAISLSLLIIFMAHSDVTLSKISTVSIKTK